jgi:hypothetical protein
MKKIMLYCCRYVCGYEDGMALSSSEEIYATPEERRKALEEDYDDDEIDIDTEEHEYGWEFWESYIEIPE